MKRLKRLPSPAMVVASVALFAALGGTSYAALSANSVTTRTIVNGTIRNEDFKDGTLRGNEFKRDSLGGGAIKEQSLDGSLIPTVNAARRADAATAAASADGLARQVVVGADGARSNDRGVVSVTKTATGRYQVIFDRDVAACVPVATLVQGTPPADRPNVAITGQIAVAKAGDNVSAINVATANAGGEYADRGFNLVVSC